MNYYFELKDSDNKIVRRFPDTLNRRLIFTTEYFEINGKKYSQYADFNLDKSDQYTLKAYSKNNQVEEIAIRKDEHVSSGMFTFLLISIACILLSIITFALSFLLNK